MIIEKNSDLISIIIPVYNVGKFLNRCLNSVINQSYKNIEIIIVDDGSIDNSPNICDEYSKKDNRIKVIHQSNMGLSIARNNGINLSKGDWLVFVDSDDYIHNNMIEKLYYVVKINKAEIALCNFLTIDEEDNVINCNDTLKNEVLTKTLALERINKGVTYNVAWNKIYKKSLFDSIKYPAKRIHEDEYISHKLFDISTRIVTISDCLYMYRIRKDGIMGKRKEYMDFSTACILEAKDDRLYYYYKNRLYNDFLFTKVRLKVIMREHGVVKKDLINNNNYRMTLEVFSKVPIKTKLHYVVSVVYDRLYSFTHKKKKQL